jgi:hypothetical protein
VNARTQFQNLLRSDEPILALAPMQDVTDLRFMRLISGYGNADLYFTEYFRVLPDSRLDPQILASITQNPTGRPVIAQMIGNDIAALVRTARELQQHPVAAIDLNLGCPVPIVYRKCAGGGLLRDPDRIDRILGALREAITIPFTVKTRIGFEDVLVLPAGKGVALTTFLPRNGPTDVRVLDSAGREMLRVPETSAQTLRVEAGPDGEFVAAEVSFRDDPHFPERGVIVLDVAHGTQWTYGWRYGTEAEPLSWKLLAQGTLAVQLPGGTRRFDATGHRL